MISIRKIFSNKHRAYLLIFTCAYIALRLPILVSNKIERVIIGALVNTPSKHGISTAYKGFKYTFPTKVYFDQLVISGDQLEPIEFNNVSLNLGLSYPLTTNFNADVFKGSVSCNFKKEWFSAELGLSCNSNNFEINEISYFKPYLINGPLSFKFSGNTFTNSSEVDINGEFLSQIDTTNLKLPKEVPSFIKVPHLGILDLKGNFGMKNTNISLSDASLASAAGDVAINLVTQCTPGFNEVLDFNSLFKVKLSPSGMQSVAPWLGLALGGIEYPASGQADIEVKGSSKSGFKSKLVN